MKFSNSYVDLGEQFYQRCKPAFVSTPKLFLWNGRLATKLQLSNDLTNDVKSLAQYFSGNLILAGSEPIAMAYAGHQFGGFNPQLGDGRAHLLGEVLDVNNVRWDLQLKGSGPSAFSRSGDGRCGMGPAIREFIMSEAMVALGVPSTQCLAVVTTGEPVYRDRVLPGAVVTRVASSHIRVGTFQFFANRRDVDSLRILADYTIDRHYPEVNDSAGNRYVTLLDKVIEKQIKLIVEWMRVGFIHGVMNTDNTAISGETIDFGPCAMMNFYDPSTVFSSIDRNGRYAFGNQPNIANWNMARFAETLLPLIDEEDSALMSQVESLIMAFADRFQKAFMAMMANKLGITNLTERDDAFIINLLEAFVQGKVDYTIGFNQLNQSLRDENVAALLNAQIGKTYQQWRDRLKQQTTSLEEVQTLMQAHNPIVIPRNHHVEAVLKSCEETGDAATALEFLEVLRNPYQEIKNTAKYQAMPNDNDENYQTFCGT